MPLVLTPEVYAAWMAPGRGGAESLMEILSSWSVTEFAYYLVSKHVNSVWNNEPGNIETVEVGLEP